MTDSSDTNSPKPGDRNQSAPAIYAGWDMNMAKNMEKMLAAIDTFPRVPEKLAKAFATFENDNFKKMLESMSSIQVKIDPKFLEVIKKLEDGFNLQTTLLPDFRLLAKKFEDSMEEASFFHLSKEFYSRLDWRRINEAFLLTNIDLSAPFKDTTTEKPEILIDESAKVKRIITDIYRKEKNLLQLTSRAFEELIAELLRHQGFEVELTKQTRDGGYDLIALKRFDSQYPSKFLVECKRYKDNVGIEIVRSLMYLVKQEEANKGIIATTGYFTRDARRHQTTIHPYLLELRDKDQVLEWVRLYGEQRLKLGKNGG
jgi:HJR/Mrr/RecB family endonuclease